MIITITSVLCMGSFLGGSITMFVIGNRTYNSDLTFGGIGPLLVFVFIFGACCGSTEGTRSMFEDTYREEKSDCIKARAEAKAKRMQQIPVVPAISPKTITIRVQHA